MFDHMLTAVQCLFWLSVEQWFAGRKMEAYCKGKTAMSIVCILHLPGKSIKDSELKPVNEQSWEKVKSAEKKRHNVYKVSKYFSIKLPDNFKVNDGYHQQSFREYTAVPKLSSTVIKEPFGTKHPITIRDRTSPNKFFWGLSEVVYFMQLYY